ncbi:tumor necrosis factor alpha-induced protein 8-like [Halichondria panicea]|uniref:tumor necrosis factor alpha-induced protein 8-like n=1 Tax=Halichondria panicea TaxID=6063 RepID=UPI00312B4F1A
MADGGRFSSKQIGLKIQKKVIGKFANRSMAKQFIDDEFGALLDTIHLILKTELKDSKKADKIIKNMIKVTVKIGLLYKNSQFNTEELALGMGLRSKLRKTALTVISFYEVDFTYDRGFLIKAVGDVGESLHKLVERHLTAKSHGRINSVIEAFSDGPLLDKVFLSDGPYHSHLEQLSQAFHKIVDSEW